MLLFWKKPQKTNKQPKTKQNQKPHLILSERRIQNDFPFLIEVGGKK